MTGEIRTASRASLSRRTMSIPIMVGPALTSGANA
jgi:hypothetical protein